MLTALANPTMMDFPETFNSVCANAQPPMADDGSSSRPTNPMVTMSHSVFTHMFTKTGAARCACVHRSRAAASSSSSGPLEFNVDVVDARDADDVRASSSIADGIVRRESFGGDRARVRAEEGRAR